MKKSRSIILSTLGLAIVMTLIDALVRPSYFVKIPIKLLLFLALPLIFFLRNKEDFADFKRLFVFKWRGILYALLLGLGVFGVIIGGYFLTRGFIDYSNVAQSLTEENGITADNFIYVSIYISLMNSFLEEFFFRGYGFITLKKHASRKLAYLISSGLFAIYHVGMLIEMFHFTALFLMLPGLMIGGCIFNFLNEKTDTVYPSWFVHMFANFGINTVGFMLFGLI